MKAILRPCYACARHVRYSETACPFCRTALARETPPELPDVSRLSRAARIALGAALATAACAGDPKPEPVAPVPVYGAPAPVEPAPVEPGADGGGGQAGDPAPVQPENPPPPTGPQDPGAVRPMYGVPPAPNK